jgi:hypothetical protein
VDDVLGELGDVFVAFGGYYDHRTRTRDDFLGFGEEFSDLTKLGSAGSLVPTRGVEVGGGDGGRAAAGAEAATLHGAGLQPLVPWRPTNLGLRPRLLWNGPSALRQVQRRIPFGKDMRGVPGEEEEAEPNTGVLRFAQDDERFRRKVDCPGGLNPFLRLDA